MQFNLKQKIKNAILNASLFVFTILIIFIVGEVVVRTLFKDDAALFPRYHTDAAYNDYTIRRLRPNIEFWHTSKDGTWKSTTNSKGLRNDREFAYKKRDDVIRIITLGDSHTQGYEVRQNHTYSAIIEKQLQKLGLKAEVINTGVSGFSTAEALIYLENEGVKYNPDYVVLGFFANDYEDNTKAGLFQLNKAGGLVAVKSEHIPGVRIQNFIYSLPFLAWLGENSYFYSMMFNKIWVTYKMILAKTTGDQALEYAVPVSQDLSGYQSSLTTVLLNRMSEFCARNNIKFIVIDIPWKKADGSLISSIASENEKSIFTDNSDVFVNGYNLLKGYSGVADIHLPHGLNHISEFSHVMLGVSVAKEIYGIENR